MAAAAAAALEEQVRALNQTVSVFRLSATRRDGVRPVAETRKTASTALLANKTGDNHSAAKSAGAENNWETF
ncbi:hypothetical protein JHU04_000001 [Brenneria sp. 4F2]|nr:hypothetical protein [Brenneria bubanii]